MEHIIEQAKRGEVGDNGFGYDETQDQEDYGTYSNYIELIETAGFSEKEAMEMMGLTENQIDSFIKRFEIDEKDEE